MKDWLIGSDIEQAYMDLAEAEGLDAHRQAVALRLNGGEK